MTARNQRIGQIRFTPQAFEFIMGQVDCIYLGNRAAGNPYCHPATLPTAILAETIDQLARSGLDPAKMLTQIQAMHRMCVVSLRNDVQNPDLFPSIAQAGRQRFLGKKQTGRPPKMDD